MTSGSEKNSPGIEGLLSEISKISEKIDEEKISAMTPADQRLDELAREILRLERDLTVPGSPSSDSVRIERLMRFIEDRDF